MSPVFAARKRAEEFQSMVDGTVDGSDVRLLDFLEIVENLRDTPEVTARPAFVAELREQLVDEARSAARLGKGAEAAARLTVVRSTTDRRRERRLAAAVGGLALVGASTGMAVASQSALPGDPLYPLKRAIENAHTSVQSDEDAKGKTLLANASGRLDEVDQLSRESDDAETISATLNTFTDQANEASDLLLADYEQNGHKDSVEDLRDFTATSMNALNALQDLVPEDARAALIQAAQTLTQIDQQALMACPTCGDNLVTQIPAFSTVALDDLKSLLNAVTKSSESEVVTSAPPAKGNDKTPQSTPEDPLAGLPITTPTEGPDKAGDKGNDGLIPKTIDKLTGGGDDKGGDKKHHGLIGTTTDALTGLLGGLLGGE
jgi:hypothetical protein